MHRIRMWVLGSLAGAVFLLQPLTAAAEDISGLITSTRTIREDSRLVGNVTCMVTGAPCITFGAPRISLRLNGFMMTGQGDPNNACSGAITANEQGINSGGQADVELRGPGVVRNFRSDGVLFNGSVGGRVEGITSTTNCQSGIRVTATSSRITIAANISVRNGASAAGAACGGI